MRFNNQRKQIVKGINQWLHVLPFIGISLVLMGMFVSILYAEISNQFF